MINHSLGFANTLDSVKSMYVPTQAGAAGGSGNGLSNNRPFGSAENANALKASQNVDVANGALQYKIGRYVDTTANSVTNGIMGNIATTTQLANEFRPYYETNGHYMIWYDFAVIKLSHLFESLDHLGLVRRFDATMRLWVNTGTVNVSVASPGVSVQYSLIPAENTFSNTCPLRVNYLNDATLGVPTGCFLYR